MMYDHVFHIFYHVFTYIFHIKNMDFDNDDFPINALILTIRFLCVACVRFLMIVCAARACALVIVVCMFGIFACLRRVRFTGGKSLKKFPDRGLPSKVSWKQ
jgi:hypothetical protein